MKPSGRIPRKSNHSPGSGRGFFHKGLMMSKSIPTLYSIIAADRSHFLASGEIKKQAAIWVNAQIDTFAAKAARDDSQAAALHRALRGELVEACREIAARPAKEEGLGRSAAKLKDAGDWEVVEAVLGETKCRTWKSYLSGAKLAFAAGVPWTPSVYATLKKKAADAKTPGAVEKKDAATASPETPEKASTDPMRLALAEMNRTAERRAEFVAFAKAKGWIK